MVRRTNERTVYVGEIRKKYRGNTEEIREDNVVGYYIELISLDILQIQASGVLSGFLAVDEAYTM